MLKKTSLLVLLNAFAVTTAGFLLADQPSATIPANVDRQEKKEEAQSEVIDIKKLSEAFGNFIGRNLKAPGINFDLENIIKGMRDGAAGKPSPLTDEEYESMMLKVQEQGFKRVSEDNLKAATEFLSKNSKAAGVIEMEPGKLQYTILEEGHGPVVLEHSSPLIQYEGKYLDGTVFGSSKDVGGAITIPVDQTIPGFGKGLVGMKEGEKRRIFVHPDLGYGTTGHLPPNSLLIFDVEVIKADNKDKNQALLDEEYEEDELLSLANREDDDYSDEEDRKSSDEDTDNDGLDSSKKFYRPHKPQTPTPATETPTTDHTKDKLK